MKVRESGMPEEQLWADFFEPARILSELGLTSGLGDVVEFGCGYGTFTIPTARIVSGTVHTFDIDPAMVAATLARSRAAGLDNVCAEVRDFTAEGTGLPDAGAAYAMLFNILHADDPLVLLVEARRVLAPGGLLGIIHWRHDPSTPRGPSMHIRPRPEQCLGWAIEAGFEATERGIIDLPPYHYGMSLQKHARGAVRGGGRE